MPKKPKKIINGGVYWMDFKEMRSPEWGNTEDGSLHLAIVIKINDFLDKEMYFAFPLTSNPWYQEHYSKNVVKTINFGKKTSYILLNQTKTISKRRIKRPYVINKKHKTLNSDQITALKNNFIHYFSYWMDLSIDSINKKNKLK